MTESSPEPRDEELLKEFRELTISIQRDPAQARSVILKWYEHTLKTAGPRKAEIGMLLRNILDAIELDRQQYSEPGARQEAEIPKIEARSERPLVISLHGIRTRGTWQKQLSSALSRNGFVYEPLDYGFFRGIQLVLPFMRDRKKKWLLEQYTNAIRQHSNPPSVIAHSFGTYLVARTMQKYDEIRFDRVIFCGSIVEKAYPWTAMLDAGRVTRVLNDYGGKDRWARAAEWFINDSGPSGANGFTDIASGRVLNKSRPEFRHSDFFYQTNYERTWIPFLSGTDPTQILDVPRRPTNWKFRITLSLILLVLLILAVLLGVHLLMLRNESRQQHRQRPVTTGSQNEAVISLKEEIGLLAGAFDSRRLQSEAVRAQINEWAPKRASEMLEIQDIDLALSHKIVKYECVTYAYMMAAFTESDPSKKIGYAELSISSGQQLKEILREAKTSEDPYVKSVVKWAVMDADTEPRVNYLLAMDYCVEARAERDPALRDDMKIKVKKTLRDIPTYFLKKAPPNTNVDFRGCL